MNAASLGERRAARRARLSHRRPFTGTTSSAADLATAIATIRMGDRDWVCHPAVDLTANLPRPVSRMVVSKMTAGLQTSVCYGGSTSDSYASGAPIPRGRSRRDVGPRAPGLSRTFPVPGCDCAPARAKEPAMPRIAVHMIIVVTNTNRDDETVDVLFE